jgi:hypothetical protein
VPICAMPIWAVPIWAKDLEGRLKVAQSFNVVPSVHGLITCSHSPQTRAS